jgi:hypothetical protein
MRASVLIPSEPIGLWCRALHAWPRARRERWLVSFRGARASGTAASGVLSIFRECRHKYISWLRTVLDFAATNDDK